MTLAMGVKIIATTRNSLQNIYFLQQIKLIVTIKYIYCNTTYISQLFISLVTTTHTCCNKNIHVAVGFVAKDQFSSSEKPHNSHNTLPALLF
jgi:hypothetical protein